MSALQVVRLHAWVALAAMVIGALVRVLKGDSPLPCVSPRVRPWLALGLGMVSGVLSALLTSTPLSTTILEGLIAGATAIAGHDTLIEGLRGGRELFSRPSLPRDPPAPPTTPSGNASCNPLPSVIVADKDVTPVRTTTLQSICLAMVLLGAVVLVGCTKQQGQAIESALAGGGPPLVRCIANDLLAGRDTFEDLSVDCGGALVAEVIGVVETLAVERAPAPPGIAPSNAIRIPLLAAKVHHASGAPTS